MANNIVVVNVSQQLAPTPNTLQQTGAMISQGGTTTAAQTLTLLTSLATLTPLLSAAKTLTSLTWSGSVVTGTTVAPHGWGVGDIVYLVISGETPAAYNGTFLATITGASTFTYPLVANPGAQTVAGLVILGDESELLAMATTYFAQGSPQAVYVLELGEGTPAAGVTALTTFITANPLTIYSYLVPREWDNVGSFITYANTFGAANAKTYFFVTTTVANRAVYAGIKAVLAVVEAPGIPSTEFSLASEWAVTLNYAPNSSNRVPPLSYAYVFGVTPYPLPGNSATLQQLNTANVGWIGTGAEGGLSNKIVFYGQMSDGNPFNYWYSADWAQINLDLNLSNEIINGSNTPLAPLYYDQPGIDRLQNRAGQTLGTAITNGLANGNLKFTQLPAAVFATNYTAGLYVGSIVINAEPFLIYSGENPSDYAIGKYAGLACVYTPSRGFKQVFFNLNVTNIIAV